jgi:hypothetical protein
VPKRVTVAVPDDLHRAIQAARGTLLVSDQIDLSYSTLLEMLARAGVIEFTRFWSDQERLNDDDSEVLRDMIEKPWSLATDEGRIAPDEVPAWEIVGAMLPILLKTARAQAAKDHPRVYTPSGRLRPSVKKYRVELKKMEAAEDAKPGASAKDQDVAGASH